MTAKEVIDRIGFAIMVGVAGIGVSEIKSMGASIADLNVKMAIVVTRMTAQDKRDEDHERRLETLEHSLKPR